MFVAAACSDEGEPPRQDLFPTADHTSGGCSACTGCCDTFTNSCQPGTLASACGFGGLSCRSCGSDEQCLNGSCMAVTPQCSANTCPGGCCGPNGCVSPANGAFCGINGSSCASCANDQICDNGQCTTPGPVTYGVIIKGATLNGEACNSFEVGDNECDAFVTATFAGKTYGPTATIENNNAPLWNETLFSATDTELTANGIAILVTDYDTLTANDEIGSCTLNVSGVDLAAGELIKNCGADVSGLALSFVKK